jgi:hypothetical protein
MIALCMSAHERLGRGAAGLHSFTLSSLDPSILRRVAQGDWRPCALRACFARWRSYAMHEHAYLWLDLGTFASVFSAVHVAWTPPAQEWRYVRLKGKWSPHAETGAQKRSSSRLWAGLGETLGRSGGGWPGVGWMHNPAFKLHVTESSRVRLNLIVRGTPGKDAIPASLAVVSCNGGQVSYIPSPFRSGGGCSQELSLIPEESPYKIYVMAAKKGET